MKRTVVASLLVLAACAKGDKIGQLDLRARGATFALDAAPGETLHFRLDCVLDAPSMAGKSNRDAKYPIYDAMKRSTIAITIDDGAGQKNTTSCQAFEIGSTNETHSSGREMSETGMPLSCVLPITKPGRQTLTATINWDPMLIAKEATLEVRKVKK